GRRRHEPAALLARHAAAAQAGACRGHSLLDDFHVQRLQHRAGADTRRSRQHHTPLRHPRVPDRPAGRQPRPRRGDLAVPVSDAGARRVPSAPLHQEGVSVARTRSLRRAAWWHAARTYANLTPFVFFALFPFYFMFVTSFKRNAELYNLKAVPFWIQTGAI